MLRKTAPLALFAALTASGAQAQEVERYQLEKTENGYVRLDTQTGRMTICEERTGQLVCRAAAEERAAYDRDLDALHDRIEALEARIGALEEGRPAAELPDEQEFEKTMGYMERFFRRFMGIARDLEREFGNETPAPAPTPDRT